MSRENFTILKYGCGHYQAIENSNPSIVSLRETAYTDIDGVLSFGGCSWCGVCTIQKQIFAKPIEYKIEQYCTYPVEV